MGRTTALALFLLIALAIGLLAYPLMIIQPFRHQDPGELQAALGVLRWRTWFEIAAVVGAIALVYRYWRAGPRLVPKIAACFGALLICVAAGLTRINVYEIMFHRYEQPTYAQAAETKLDDGEMVISIKLNGQARAYPIRSMSYHHLVNDEVGGIPVVATY